MSHPPSPAPLIELATAYWGSATLVAACRLELFTALAEGPLGATAVAARLESDPVATEALLAGLTALKLLTKDGEVFSNTALSDAYLVAGRPGYLGPALIYNGDVYPLWADLHAVIRDGDTRAQPDAYLGDDAERTRNFVWGMHHRALGVGRAVAQVIDLSGRRALADIGGGPGTYACLLTGQTPGLKATVMDLPAVVAIAAEIIETMGASERVETRPFDYYADVIEGQFDCGLISGVLHREQPEQVKAILHKAAAVIEPGGVLYLSDVMLDDDRAGPLFGTMFALNMRVLAHDGRCHSVAEQRAWLEEAGFDVTEVTTLPAPIHYTIIKAARR